MCTSRRIRLDQFETTCIDLMRSLIRRQRSVQLLKQINRFEKASDKLAGYEAAIRGVTRTLELINSDRDIPR